MPDGSRQGKKGDWITRRCWSHRFSSFEGAGMISHSNMMAVAGCIVMAALAIAAVGLGTDSDDVLFNVFSGHDNVPVGEDPSLQRSVSDATPDADVQFILQTVSDNLRRNDLTSARVLLNTVLATRKDQPRALELQRELQARESEAERNIATRYASAPLPAKGATKNDGVHHVPPTPHRASRHPRDRKELALNARSASESRAAPRRGAQMSSIASPHDAEFRSQDIPRGQHQKTRSEVREELKRARADGSIPRYGNPDAYGPGGSPNDTSPRWPRGG